MNSNMNGSKNDTHRASHGEASMTDGPFDMSEGAPKPGDCSREGFPKGEEAVFRSIFDQHPTVMLIIDPLDGSILHANAAAANFYGWSLDELVNRKISDINILPPEAVHAEMALALSQQSNFFQFQHRLADGRIREVESRSAPIPWGDRLFLCSVITDVTDRMAAEQEMQDSMRQLAQVVAEQNEELAALNVETIHRKLVEMELNASERKYRQLVQDAQIIIMHVDEMGKILFVNQYGRNFFGYSDTELSHSPFIGTLIPQFDELGQNLLNLFEDTIKNPSQYKKHTSEIVRKDGRRAWVEWINRFQRDVETGEAYIVAVGIDITERQRMTASVKFNLERQRRKLLLLNVLENRISQDELLKIADKEGWSLVPPFVCCLVVFDFSHEKLLFLKEDPDEWQAWMDTATDLIKARLGGFAWQAEQGIAILQSLSGKAGEILLSKDSRWAENVADTMRDVFRNVDFIIGVSTVQPKINAAYVEAVEAATFGPVLFPDRRIQWWQDLGTSRLLLNHIGSDSGEAFVHDFLGPLQEKPSLKNKELLLTLQEIIHCESLEKAAERLHVHRKTIDFRRRKIEGLLHVKLDNPDTRINLSVALKLMRLRELKK